MLHLLFFSTVAFCAILSLQAPCLELSIKEKGACYAKIDLTISVIVALAAIISPILILTAIINNHYQLKLKHMELKQKEYEETIMYKRNIFENYLRNLNDVFQHPTNKSLSRYAQYYPLACLYLPEDIGRQLSEVNHKLGKSVHVDIADDIDEIIIAVSNELQKL